MRIRDAVFVLLMSVCGYGFSCDANESTDMVIDIQDGFKNNSLVVSANGVILFESGSVSSDEVTGFYGGVNFSFLEGEKVSLRVSSDGVIEEYSVPDGHVFIGVSKNKEGGIVFVSSEEPFFYD